jgi:uncharacterized membrane protein
MPYKGIFAVAVVASLVVIVYGWQLAAPNDIYQPPTWAKSVSGVLVILAAILFVSGRLPTNVKRMHRHPQLMGAALWSIAHLLANGDDRSLVLFGGIGAWAVVEVVSINARQGEWTKPDKVPVTKDVIAVVVGVVLFGILHYAHPYLTGVPLMPA